MSTKQVIEPSEPKAAPASPHHQEAPSIARTRVAGAQLEPDIAKNRDAVVTRVAYWIGALPGLPTESLDLNGVHFPKLQQRVIKTADGDTQRAPLIGSIVRLTIDEVRRIRDRLPRTVVRFTDGDKKPSGVGGVGSGVDAVMGEVERRKGFVITIPTAAQIEERRKAGRPTNAYEQRPGDEPAARYVFAMLCPNQERPARGDHYPEPLSVTGLEWPGKLD